MRWILMGGCFGAGRRSWGIIGGVIKVCEMEIGFAGGCYTDDKTEAVAAGVIPSNAASINKGICNGV
jgi:hypothetical protein